MSLAGEEPVLADFTDVIRLFVEQEIGAPAVIAGHSLGSLIAIDFAARHAELCSGIIAVCAVYDRSSEAIAAVQKRAAYLRTAHGDEDIVTSPIQRWFGDAPTGHDKEMADMCAGWLQSADKAGYAAAYTVFANQRGPGDAVLSDLNMPSLFVTGAGDPNSTPLMSNAMADKALKGEAVIIEGARHMPQMTHHAVVNEVFHGFLKKHHLTSESLNHV